MEIEVVGKCIGFKDNDLIILDDDNELINIDKTFFTKDDMQIIINSFINKRISFYYSNELYSKGILFDIIKIEKHIKQSILNFNYLQGNYYLTPNRMLKTFNLT